MKKVLAACMIIGIALCSYQQQPTFKLQLTVNEINTVVKGLSELPHKESAVVIEKILTQAQDTAFQKRK